MQAYLHRTHQHCLLCQLRRIKKEMETIPRSTCKIMSILSNAVQMLPAVHSSSCIDLTSFSQVRSLKRWTGRPCCGCLHNRFPLQNMKVDQQLSTETRQLFIMHVEMLKCSENMNHINLHFVA
jgi:hypothetical protein